MGLLAGMAPALHAPACARPFAAPRLAARPCPRPCAPLARAQPPRRPAAVQAAERGLEAWKPASLVAVTNILMALPAHAEAGKIFDFNATLPIMTAQFLLLMVFLDKFWFGPVGKVLDERDKLLRQQLGEAKDNSGDIEALQKEAEEVLKAARREAQETIKAAKDAADEESTKKLAEVKAKVDKELEEALAQLQKEKDDALAGLDAQVEKLSGDILARILPEGVKL